MALTVFETSEQLLPCHAEQGDGGKVVVAAERAVLLQETDHGGDEDRPERDDIWNMIQSQRPAAAPARQAPYVHPLVRRSSSLLSQKSLEICTESLGSETGSDGFSDADGATDRSCPGSDDDGEEGAEEVAARARPPRAFPPPLPSLARRTAGALQMRQHRRDGRLVVEAVPVPSPTLFCAQRRGGRLFLSFADTAAPASDEEKNHGQEPEPAWSTTTAAAALAAASALSVTAAPPGGDGTGATPGESKLLMTARRQRSKEELLNHMRRCGQLSLSGQLFIREPCIATSS